MQIRPATSDDLDALLGLYEEYEREAEPRPAPPRAEQILAAIRAHGEVWLAEQEGRITGSYSFYLCNSLGHGGHPFAIVENVIVAACARRQGIGRALMRHAQEEARTSGCYKLMLCTGRAENVAFYQACGFRADKFGLQVRFEA